MNFKINNRNWEIKEVDGQWLLDEYKKDYDNAAFCFGLTKYSNQIIYINKDMKNETKKLTLYHELMHCYIWNYLHSCSEYGEEVLCDVSANSHDIIHKIVEDYFKFEK